MPQINRLGPSCVCALPAESVWAAYLRSSIYMIGGVSARGSRYFTLHHARVQARVCKPPKLHTVSAGWPAGERNFHLVSSLSRISRHSQLHITLAFLVTRTLSSTETVGWRTDVNNSSSPTALSVVTGTKPIFVFPFSCFCFFAFGIHSSLVSGQTERRRDWHAFPVNRECTAAAVEKNCGNQI